MSQHWSLGRWAERIADMSTKARTIQKCGKLIEECAIELQEDLDTRIEQILKELRMSVIATVVRCHLSPTKKTCNG